MIKAALSVAAFLSPLLFPPFAVVLIALCAAFYVPPVALATGLVVDALYYVPGASAFPIATFFGFFGMIGAIFARRFIAARVMPL